jgi:alpha-L-fucosidase 2
VIDCRKEFTMPALSFPILLALFAGPLPGHGLDYKTPATTWDEGLPLGNGLMGALVWGDGAPLKISLDRADLWDLRRVPEFAGPEYKFSKLRALRAEGRFEDIRRVYEAPYHRPAPTKIPAGRIELALEGAFAGTGLDVAAAEAHYRSGGARIRVFVHATQPVGMLRIEAAALPAVALRAPAFQGEVKEGAKGGISPGDLQQLGYPAPVESSGEGFRAYRQQGAEGFVYAARVGWKRRGEGWDVAWSIMTGAGAEGAARRQVEAALSKGYEAMRASHVEWWSGYWRQSSVRLPNAVLERQWYLEQYKFGSAARRGAPPITLQAVWTADDGKLPPWKGDYHHDLNTELSYWPCYSGNHLEEGLGFLDWLWETRGASREWTREFFELPGLNVPMTADLNGRQIGGWVQYTHSPTTAAWLAHHFYLHWRYSRDTQFLRTRAYPYVAEAAEFLEAFTRERDARGRRTVPLSASPEINDNKPSAWFDSITNYDLALARWLFGAAAELAGELGMKEEAGALARRARRVSRIRAERFGRARGGRGLSAAGLPPALLTPDGNSPARPDRHRYGPADGGGFAGRSRRQGHDALDRLQLLLVGRHGGPGP